MEIGVTAHFVRRYKKLPRRIRQKAQAQERIFRENPFDPRIKTHKLRGKREEEWTYSVGYSYRIIFVFLNREAVLYLDIGTHDELY